VPSSRDLLLALGAVVALQLDVWLLEEPHGSRAVTAVFAAALGLVLLLRRSHPQALAVTTSGVLVAQALADARLTSMLTSAVVAMVITASVALQLPRPRALVAGAALLLGAWADLVVQGSEEHRLASDLVFTGVVVVGLPWLAGQAVRHHRERERELEELARQLAAEREHRAELAVLDERNRIAREMHDVVAHSVSLMVVQAGAARRMLDTEPEASRGALLSVEDVGREALAELRRVLGLLRGTSEPVGLRPQPGTAQLGSLVEGTRASGLAVELEVDGQPRPLQAGVDLAVYRVVQEALTNAVKHARASRAQVRLVWRPDALDVEVVDDGSAPLVPSQGGHGLVGMRERLTAYGGRLDAGPVDGGGFRVRARIPVEEVAV
jgi:signal transduction histidine kinase